MPNPYLLTDPKDVDGIVLHSANPRMQSAFRRFIDEELKLVNPVTSLVPSDMQSFVSPLALKFAGQILAGIGKLVRKTEVSRVVLILSEDDLTDVKKLGRILHIPKGKDSTLPVLGFAKMIISEKIGVNVEAYFAKVNGNEIQFFRIDEA